MTPIDTASIDRTSCIIGTAGHIDHGKTTLVAALTGIDTDRLVEEKKRGLSIDIGFAHMDFERGGGGVLRAALVDVPGHERFIKNMLTGATGVDLVLFVVAADDGIMPQTREHLDIVRLLGISKAIFVITKTDLADAARIKEVEKEVEALVSGTTLAASPVVPFSSVTGEGVEGLKALIHESIGAVERGHTEGGIFRLPVDRSFAVKGFGTVVTGTIAAGAVKKGDDAILFPTGVQVKVRGIQSTYLDTEMARAGQRAALNISGVNHRDVSRGFVLASPELVDFTKNRGAAAPIDCLFEFTRAFVGSRKIKNRLFKVHHLTDETLAAIQLTGRKEAGPGEKVWGRLLLRKPMLMQRGDRFILRDPSINSTVGGGAVFIPYLSKVVAPRITRAVFPKTFSTGPADALSTLLDGRAGFEGKGLRLMLGIREQALDALVKNVPSASRLGGYVVNAKKAEEIEKAVNSALTAFHAKKTGEAGMGEDALYVAVRPFFYGLAKAGSAGLFREISNGLVSRGVIKKAGGLFALGSHRPALSGMDATIEAAILRLFPDGLRPPMPEDIKKLGFNAKDVERVMAYLQRNGAVVRIKEGVYVSGEAITGAREKLVEYMKEKGGIRAAEFRDILGCGRKLAIEILEYFDGERVTLRSGDVRTLR